ncbi:MAG: 50S ribosomal protein L6 [bacterium]|nr:50S ribosomal protein L6 [bacterium]
MSKIGRQPIAIPTGVTVSVDATEVTVQAAAGDIRIQLLRGVKVAVVGSEVVCELVGTGKQARSSWGTMRALIANAVAGLVKPFEKSLILEGVGYRVTKEGNDLVLALGFSHPVKYAAIPGITFEVGKNSTVTVRGSDRARVGQVAAEIRALKKPEPYKGKGFHYSDEVVRRKAGKKAATSTTK